MLNEKLIKPKISKLLLIGSALSVILIAGALNAAPKAAPTAASLVKINSAAPIGGNITINLGAEPPTLHPIMYSDVSAETVLSNYACDTLLRRDPTSGDFKPRMAEKFEISKDGKTINIILRSGMKFHDGNPVMAEDVKFSFDAIKIPEHLAADKIPFLDGIEKIEIINETNLKFHLKNTYFMNINAIGSVYIIEKKAYEDIKKSVTMTREAMCAGPYKIEKFERGQRILAKRDLQWYGFALPGMKGEGNFETVTFRFIKEKAVEIESIKKGDIDLVDVPMRPDDFYKLAEGPMFGKTVFKVEALNSGVRPFGFTGWNFKNEIFQDKSVRLALSHLMNREEMNQKFRFGKSEFATGPHSKFSEYADPSVKAIEFNPKKAQELLSKAGWKDSDKDGVLDKVVNGKKLSLKFTTSHSNKDSEKYLTIWKEDLKKAGIDMDLRYMEWNSFTKMLDEKSFDAIAMSWGAGDLDWDPKQIWHSVSIDGGGSNFISYRNPEVDKLIDEARLVIDRNKRIAKLRKVYRMIAEDAPYTFWFNNKYDLYIYTAKIGRPGDSFEKEIGTRFWWRIAP